MVDPISIATTGYAVVASIAKVSKSIIDLKKGADSVDNELDSLFSELQSLHTLADNISTCFRTDVFIQASRKFNEDTPTNFFNDVHRHLGHCHRTTVRLQEVLSEVGTDGKSSLYYRGLRHRKLDERQIEIGRIRAQLGSHTMCLNLSLTNIQIFRSMQSDQRDQMAFDQLNIKVDNLGDLIQKSTATRADVEKTIQQSHNLSDEEKTILNDIDSIRQSSIKIQRRASQDIQKRLSSIAGTERGFGGAYLSEAGVPLTPEKKAGIKQWASLAALKEVDDHESTGNLTRQRSGSESVTDPDGNGGYNDLLQRSTSSPSPIGKQSNTSLLSIRTGGHSRSRSREGAPISGEEFERAMAQTLGSAEAKKTRSDKPFSDEDFNEIGRLLRQAGKPTWSDRPRTYLVLRMLDEVQAMDDFVMLGCKDIHFPYTEDRLPSCLSTVGQRQSFLQKQSLVLSPKTADLVKGGPHRHLDGSADAGFTIQGTLGRGGQGVIDQVRSKLTLQEYARKRIHRPRLFAKDKEALRMFENEIHHLKRLEHSHLVRFIGSYTDRKYVGIIMEPVAETDLRRYLTRPSFPEKDLANLKCFIGCLCAAVQYLHSQNCRHKDLKPGNILIIGPKVYITDFGIAHGWSEIDHDTTTGKPGPYTNSYVAPEVAHAKARNMKADIWSLGCVFLDILTVLKGSNLERKKEFFVAEGTCSVAAWENRPALEGWITMLEDESSEHEKPLQWIRQMTSEDPTARPDASTLMEDILHAAEDGDTYCGICCGEDLVSDETSWRGSESEEDEKEVITSSYTLSSSISPSLSPNSGMAGSAMEKDLEVKSPVARSVANIVRPKLPRFEWQTQTDTFITAVSSAETSDAAKKEMRSLSEPVDSLKFASNPPHRIAEYVDHHPRESQQSPSIHVVVDESSPTSGPTPLSPEREPPLPPEQDPRTESKTRAVVDNLVPLLRQVKNVWSSSSENPERQVTENSETKLGSHHREPSGGSETFRSTSATLVAESIPAEHTQSEQHVVRLREQFWSDSSDFESYLSSRRDNDTSWISLLFRAVKPLDTSKTLCTMLHVAAAFEKREMAKQVITAYVQAGAKVNALNFASNIPLQYAAAKDRMGLVEYFLEAKSDASHRNIRKQTALHIAAREQSEGAVSVLVQHMSVDEINAKDDCGRTALHQACKSGNFAIAKLLAEAGADIDANDDIGHTPVMRCNFEKSAEFFHYFREQRASIQKPDADQREPGIIDEVLQTGLFMSSPEYEVGVLLGPFGDTGPWGGTNHCQCPRCRIVNLVENLLNAEQERIMKCTCADHIGEITTQLLSDVLEVHKTIIECPCKGCAESRLKCGTTELAQPARFCACENCLEANNYYVTDICSMEFYRGHDYYDQRIEKAIPKPCGCADCKAARGAAAVRMLANAGFTGKRSYRLDPKKAWLWMVDVFTSFASNNSAPMIPDVLRDITVLLLSCGANINTTDNDSNTLLHVVAASGNLAMASLLLSRKAWLNIEDKEGDTPLINALFFHRPEMVRLLLREGAQIDKLNGGSKRPRANVVHYATNMYGNLGYFLPMLLAHKPNVNIEDVKFQVPLQWTIYHRNAVALRLLVEAGGANIELATKAAPRPILYAMIAKAPELVRMLVAYGAEVHARGTEPSAIHGAADLAAGESILVLLESSDALEDLEKRDSEKRTPLHVIADRVPRPDVTLAAQAMIAAGASLAAEDMYGNTPLHIACRVGSIVMTRLLVEAGAVREAQNHAGKTPCDLAVSKRHKDVVEFLGGTMKKKRWYQSK